MVEKIIIKIFKEIDKIIQENLNQRPIIFERSGFKKDYEKLKKEYLNGK